MLEKYLRPIYQRYLVDQLAAWIACHTFITPIFLTGLAIFFGLLSASCIIFGYYWLASVALLISGYLDTLDGSLARIKKSSTNQGAIIDIIGDRIVEVAIIFGLLCVDPGARSYAIFWMLASSLLCITSFLVVGIFLANTGQKSFHYSPGLMERAEAFTFFIVMILVPSSFHYLAWSYTLLVLFTAFYRVYEFMKPITIKE